MRTSFKRTTAAVLRSVIGIKDLEMSELVKCSVATIHSIECGRLKLSEDLAMRMSHETGVSLSWLLKGDTKAPATSAAGGPYSRDTFERARAKQGHCTDKLLIPAFVVQCHARIRAILESAQKRGDAQLGSYKLEKALDALADEFGQAEEIHPRGAPLNGNVCPIVERDLEDTRFVLQLSEMHARKTHRAGV